jgi:hypothetical protein
MNVLDATVTSINGPAREAWGAWWVPVTYTCYGSEGRTDVHCRTKEQAEAVKVGDTIQV